MQLTGPDSFELAFDETAYRLVAGGGSGAFTRKACSKIPKLYVVAANRQIIYVGVTKQPMRNRLRLGWAAKGETGYYGYAWRRALNRAHLHVWYHDDADERSCRDVETVEAEVAFLVRLAGQWPAHQTEIHFYPSSAVHRAHASDIIRFVSSADAIY